MTSRWRLLLLFALLFYAPRVAFIAQPLVGEEGIFADLMAKRAPAPDYALVGRVQGQEIRNALGHPVTLYLTLQGWGWACEKLGLNFSAGHGSAWRFRLAISAFQWLVWALLIGLLAPALAQSPQRWLWVAVLVASPLAVGGSLDLQTDSSSGSLLAGFVALALLTRSRGELGLMRAWTLPLAFFLVGWGGKQEWSLGLAAGSFGGLWLGQWNGSADADELPLLLRSSLCLAVGNVASWALGPADYLGAFGVAGRISSHHGTTGYYLDSLKIRAPFLAGLVPLWAVAVWLVTRGKEKAGWGLRWALGASLCLGLPFFFVAWGSDYRYYVPSYMVLAPMILATLVLQPLPWAKTAWLCLALETLFLGRVLYKGRLLMERYPAEAAPYLLHESERIDRAITGNCTQLVTTGQAWDRGDFSWVGDTTSAELARTWAAAKGSRLCPW